MSAFEGVSEVRVGIQFRTEMLPVGRLAAKNGQIYFEYSRSFIETGLEISPFQLPLQSGLKSFSPALFEGLPGVFDDSLPDGWGRLLFDRHLRARGIWPQQVTPLDRLCFVGRRGLGALVYEPETASDPLSAVFSLDQLSLASSEILQGRSEDALHELLVLNGSSSGARPKTLIGVDESKQQIVHALHDLPQGFSPWLVKFPNQQDGADAGAIEFVYSLMAKNAGLETPESHLFPSKTSPGYFGLQRFDRRDGQQFHMHTACGLLHSDFRAPSLDYQDLLALTWKLTRDHREVEKLYRLAVFNVLAHNRDDHGKNFSFLMDSAGTWRLSPAYDLTFSFGPRGEQSTMVLGEGRSPTVDHLKRLGQAAGLKTSKIELALKETQAAVAEWENLAKHFGVAPKNINLIAKRIKEQKMA